MLTLVMVGDSYFMDGSFFKSKIKQTRVSSYDFLNRTPIGSVWYSFAKTDTELKVLVSVITKNQTDLPMLQI